MEAAWETYLRAKLALQIASSEPAPTSITIDVADVARTDVLLADSIIELPKLSIAAAMAAMRGPGWQTPPGPRSVQLISIPSSASVALRDIRSSHLGKLVRVACKVKTVEQQYVIPAHGAYRCQRCATVLYVDHTETEDVPKVCDEDQGGCGRPATMKLLSDESRFADRQVVMVEDADTDYTRKQNFAAVLEGDLVGKLSHGDSATINAILTTTALDKKVKKSTPMDFALHVVGIEDYHDDRFDIDAIAVSASHVQQDRMRSLMKLIRGLAASSARGRAAREEVLQAAEKEGIARDKAEAALAQLKRIGQLIEPNDGFFQPT